MCRITRREREILEKLNVMEIDLAAQELGVKPSTIYVVRARVRGKFEMARDLLKEEKHFRRALGHSQREY